MTWMLSVIYNPLRMRQISIAAKNGKVAYDPPTHFPTQLQALYLQDIPEAKNFCKHIRKYNNL